jgi:hypothetical protein
MVRVDGVDLAVLDEGEGAEGGTIKRPEKTLKQDPTPLPNIAATVSYAYFATSDPEFDGVDSEYSGHGVLGGIRYSF